MSELIEVFLPLAIVAIVLTGIAAKYWKNPFGSSIRKKLKESEEQVGKLQKVADYLGRTIHDLELKMQKQLESVEGKVAHLIGDVTQVQREAHDIDKHVGNLEVKTDVAATKVDAILHQVGAEVGELKRIDDQVKDSVGKVKSNALHIQYLEDEVRILERELAIPRRQVHID